MSEGRSVDNLPDLGIKFPENEKKTEEIRQSAVQLVVELNKSNNYEAYRQAVINLFRQFNISPITSNPNLAEKNEKLWKERYDFYHEMKSINPNYKENLMDIEMFGEGAYANINLKSETINTLRGTKRITKISPGACSLPTPVPSDSQNKWHFPEKNFYRTFEEVIGVDISSKNGPDWPKNPNTIQELSKMHSFYVIDNKYYRVNATESKTRVRVLIGKITAFMSGNPSRNLKP